jgi:predicted CoA-substrate-specific enzyme activase
MFVGIDSGAATVKTVITGEGKRILTSNVMPTGREVTISSENSFRSALEEIGASKRDIKYIIATGYARRRVPFADQTVTEILCHAKGGRALYPNVMTVIDIGGQDSKVIGLNEEGTVTSFVMNDKCAAGTGRFLEVMADVLEVGINSIGPLSLQGNEPCSISSTCTVFAESEVITYRTKGEKTENILAGLHQAIAKRVSDMGRRIGYKEDILFTGGVAKNPGMHKALEKQIREKILIPKEPQIIGAFGAALWAKERYDLNNS